MQRAFAMTHTQAPRIRYGLKSLVVAAGYPTYAAFAHSINVHPVHLSKILNGHEHPSANVQRKLAAELGLTLKELRELL